MFVPLDGMRAQHGKHSDVDVSATSDGYAGIELGRGTRPAVRPRLESTISVQVAHENQGQFSVVVATSVVGAKRILTSSLGTGDSCPAQPQVLAVLVFVSKIGNEGQSWGRFCNDKLVLLIK